jgi:putative ABC transport system permease protein
MSGLLKDFSWAARGLWRRPGFTVMAAGMLALGLGFNTALFALVHAVVLKPLPYSGADRIAMLWTGRNPDGTGGVNSYADYLDWKARATSFSSIAAYNIAMATLTDAGDPEEIGGATVSPEFFAVLGARVQHGRAIAAGDEVVPVDKGRAVVISDSLWTRRFHRDPSIVGRSIVLNDRRRQVIGILTADFKQPEPFWGMRAEFWTPMAVSDQMRTEHGFHYLRVIGRLAPGRTLAAAGAEMDVIGKSLMAAHPVTNTESVVVAPIRDELVGDTQPLLWMFLGAVSLVLLLAVANIVNLLLARASGRQTELALRAALGASRRRLISQLVCESTLIGLVGGVSGLAFAQMSLALLIRYGAVTAPGVESASLDATVLSFAALLSAATGAMCGLFPALRVVRGQTAGSTVGEMRGSAGAESSRTRRWLVAIETALAVPLLVGAALLAQTLIGMQNVNPGFDPSHTLQFRLTLAGARYEAADTKVAFFTDLRRRLSAAPGVSAVGIVTSLPLGGLNNTGATVVYRKADGSMSDLSVGNRWIAGDYFASLNVPMLNGRAFTDADTDTVIVNDAAAQEMWGSANPIGQMIRFGSVTDAKQEKWLTVVGVAGGMRHEALTRPARAEVFAPYRMNPWSTMTVTLRGSGDPAALAAPARAIVNGMDPRMPLVNLGPVAQFIDGQLARPRFGVMCAAVFGMIGLALAAFGTFAVLSLLVAQRTREIGIRMALGAKERQIVTLIASQSLIPAVIGCLAGGLLAGWLARLLSSQLFGVTSHDPRAFGFAVALLTASACAASWWPTRRAMRVNPIVALRGE